MSPKKPIPRLYGPATVREDGSVAIPSDLRREMGIGEADRLRFLAWVGEGRFLVIVNDEGVEETGSYFSGLGFPPRTRT